MRRFPLTGKGVISGILLTLLSLGILALAFDIEPIVAVHGMAADCQLEYTGEKYIGVRYKAALLENELSETGWVLLFGESGFTMNGEYQPHFMDLMIKGWWADIYDDPLCSSGFPAPQEVRREFSVEFGLSDYEDAWVGQDNDIAAWSQDPELFPRMFTNIDSSDPQAPDKIMTVYQVDEGGSLEGREIEVSFERKEVTTLPSDENYFMDPDLPGEDCCRQNSQDDILYRRWVATLVVPCLSINSSVDFYVNADQGDKIIGSNALNFMWENYRRPVVESDKFKVILFDLEVKTVQGEWRNATRFLVDLRTPNEELPLNGDGQLVGGFRKVIYKDRPAIEASFGYGCTDYVIDGDPNDYEPTDASKAVIDLQYPPTRAEVCELENSLLNAPADKVYFLYADPAFMTRPEAAYDMMSGGIVYGLCTNTQHQGFNTTKDWLLDTGAINATTISNATIAMFGGTFPQVSVKYYVEDAELTPIKEGWNSTHFWFENRTGDEAASLPWATVAAGHEDFFVIEYMYACTECNNTFLFIYGFDWRGTWAGGIYFKEVMVENLSNYERQYYIFHWVDDSGQDGIPQSSEIVMTSSG